MKLRVGVLQLNPQRGAISSNIERANKILSMRLGSRPLDLLVLPEFGLHGYKYTNRNELEPYLESSDGGGPGIEWAKSTSKNLNCHVILGYPEKGDNGKIYNSASLVDPKGDIAYNFRKSFLYQTDEAFECSENEKGFESVKIGDNVKIQVGICMDLNPYKFEAPFDAYEFANKAKENNVNLVVCPMAWLNSQSPSIQESLSHEEKMAKRQQLEKEFDDSSPPETSTVNYWALRMFPYLNGAKGFQNDKRVGYICANRCGWEDDILYAGSSSIFTFNGKDTQSYSDSIEYYGSLGTHEENLLYHEIDID